MKPIHTFLSGIGMTMLMGACGASLPPLATVAQVDIPRFMGDWYVIANIPTWLEEGAHNAVESYRLDTDGTIATTFTFRKGDFDGPRKTYTPRGFVLDPSSNAEWKMQFVWPFKAEYLIIYLNEEYTQTVIGRNKRDYVWIMARTPVIPESDYRRIVEQLAAAGYDTKRIQRVPQRWPENGTRIRRYFSGSRSGSFVSGRQRTSPSLEDRQRLRHGRGEQDGTRTETSTRPRESDIGDDRENASCHIRDRRVFPRGVCHGPGTGSQGHVEERRVRGAGVLRVPCGRNNRVGAV